MLIALTRPGYCNGWTRLGTVLAMLLAGTIGSASVVGAEDSGRPLLSLRGFGTLGAVHSSLEDADFVGNRFQQDGAGRTRSWAASVDSKLGLQLDARFNPRLSTVLQLVARYDHEGRYSPEVEWLYIDYQITPAFTVRVGRIVIASFMESETRQVGYTYPWARPPQEVYDINPSTHKDGIDLLYRFGSGELTNSLQLSYGDGINRFPDGGKVDAAHATSLQYLAEFGDTKFRLGYETIDLDVTQPGLDSLFDGMAQFGAAVPGATGRQALFNARRFRALDTRYEIFSAGITHEPGNWLLRAEWAMADIHSPGFISDTTGWYLTAGYRLGSFTPYVTAAQLQADRLAAPAIPTAGLPVELAQAAAALDAGLDKVLEEAAPTQKRLALGLRWDFSLPASLKLQFDHLRTGKGAAGRLSPGPDFEPGDHTNAFSLILEFVF